MAKGVRYTEEFRELPLQAPEQAIAWARAHGGTEGCVHHSDHGSQYISLVYSARVEEYGMPPSTGTVGDSYDNALAERMNNCVLASWRPLCERCFSAV